MSQVKEFYVYTPDGFRPIGRIPVQDSAESPREIEFRVSETHLQWRYVGDEDWIDILELSEIAGGELPSGGLEFQIIEKGNDGNARWTSVPTVKGLQLDTTDPSEPATGRLTWNDGDQVPQFTSNGITVNLGLETIARCRNVTGQIISRGTAVCIVGASAQRISIAPSDRTQPGSACRTLGILLEDVATNNFAKVCTFGLVKGLKTDFPGWEEGVELFVGPTPGSLSPIPPESPARRLSVAYVVTRNPTNGILFVTLKRGVKMEEIDDLEVENLQDKDLLRYVEENSRWENFSLAASDIPYNSASSGLQATNLQDAIDEIANLLNS